MTDIRIDQAVHSLIKYLIWPTLENSTENAYKTEWFKSFIINTDTGSSKLKTYANIGFTFYCGGLIFALFAVIKTQRI